MIMLCAQMIVMDWYFESGAAFSQGTAVYNFYYVMMIIANVTMYIALALTIVSLIDYLIKNKDVLKDVD